PIGRRFVFLPKRRLRPVAVPGILLAGDVSIEKRLVLKFISAESPGEGVLCPDNLAANLEAGRFESVLKLALPRRGMTNVEGSTGLDDCSKRSESGFEESLEFPIGQPV